MIFQCDKILHTPGLVRSLGPKKYVSRQMITTFVYHCLEREYKR